MTKLQTVLLALLAYVVAGALYVLVPTHLELAAGVAMLASILLGWAKQHPEDAANSYPPNDKQAGHATTASLIITYAIAFLFMLVSFAYSRPARADWETVSPGVYKTGSWVAHPNFTVSAGQLNVKDALDFGIGAKSLERVALMGGYGLTYHGEKVTVGGGVYFGTGISAKTPNAPQVNLLLTLWDAFATGPGVQRVTYPSGTVAYQMLWTLGLNYAAGGTVSKVAPWFDKLLNACVSGAACAL